MRTYVNLCESNPRKNVMITLPIQLAQKSRELGLNISKITEKALLDHTARLTERREFNSEGIERARWDSNPRLLTPEASVMSWLSRPFRGVNRLKTLFLGRLDHGPKRHIGEDN